MPQVLQKIKAIYSPVVPPQGATVKETLPDGRTVYTETEVRERMVPVLDQDGNPTFRGGNPVTGVPGVAVRRRERYEVDVEYVIDQAPNAVNSKNYHFRESAEEIARQERKVKLALFQEKLAEKVVDGGLDIDKAIEGLAAMGTTPADLPPNGTAVTEPEKPEKPEAFALKMVRPGHWLMPDGELFKGKKVGAVEALDKVYGREAV